MKNRHQTNDRSKCSSLDSFSDEHIFDLTPQGMNRAADIYRMGQNAVRRRGKNRSIRNSALVLSSAMLLISLIIVVNTTSKPQAITAHRSAGNNISTPDMPNSANTHSLPHEAPNPPDIEPPSQKQLVHYVSDDPDILTRATTFPTHDRLHIEFLDDEGLLATLQDAGMPAGIIRQNNHIRLTFYRHSTDTDSLYMNHTVSQ